MSVVYNAHLGLYFGEPEAVHQDRSEAQRFYVTDNLATQKWKLIGDSGDYRSGSWYRWMLDSVNRTGSTIVGKTFRSYCSWFCSGTSDNEYYETTVHSSAPAAPVTSGAAYTIGNGTGRVLAQTDSGRATTSRPAGTVPLSAVGSSPPTATARTASPTPAAGSRSASTPPRTPAAPGPRGRR